MNKRSILKAGDIVLVSPSTVASYSSSVRVYGERFEKDAAPLDIFKDTYAVVLNEPIDTYKEWYTVLIDGRQYMALKQHIIPL